MKKCPNCGYEDTPTGRQILRRYKTAFGELPVRDMLNRGWICADEPTPVPVETVRAALIQFLGLKDAAELKAFLRGELDPLERLCAPPASNVKGEGT